MNYKDINTYDYDLDESLIAQVPIKDRDSSKLLVVNKNNGNLKDEVFHNIVDYFEEGDVLVLNNTKVLQNRLYGFKEDTGAKIEVFLLKELESDVYECLIRPQKRVHAGVVIKFDDEFKCEVLEKFDNGITHVKFIYEGIFLEHLARVGTMPLPPYIHEKLEDNDRYNTVYAKKTGSSAAPTAGLHFTEELLSKIKAKGVEVLYVCLNVGLGTFRPVSEDDITNHDMHSELYEVIEVLDGTESIREEALSKF